MHTFKDKKDAGESKLAVQYAFYLGQMSANETIYDYKRGVDTALQGFTLTRQDLPDAEIQVEHFITRLDPNRYGQLQLAYKNRLREKPKTLLEAYAAARDHCVIRAQGGSSTISNAAGSASATLTAANGTATMLVANGENQGVDSAKKDKKLKSKAHAEAAVPTSKPPNRDCYLCGDLPQKERRHWTGDCPRMPQILGLVQDGTISCAFGDLGGETSDEESFGSVCL